jgi:hypothetical protein
MLPTPPPKYLRGRGAARRVEESTRWSTAKRTCPRADRGPRPADLNVADILPNCCFPWNAQRIAGHDPESFKWLVLFMCFALLPRLVRPPYHSPYSISRHYTTRPPPDLPPPGCSGQRYSDLRLSLPLCSSSESSDFSGDAPPLLCDNFQDLRLPAGSTVMFGSTPRQGRPCCGIIGPKYTGRRSGSQRSST